MNNAKKIIITGYGVLYTGLLARCNKFSTNLSSNEDWPAKMAAFGITTGKQNATLLRDRAAGTPQEWYSKFIANARIVPEDKPLYLGVPGIANELK